MINLNGKILAANQDIDFNNRAFKYGDALFETIRVFNGKIPFFDYHFERLLAGMQILNFDYKNSINKEFLLLNIHKIIQHKGNHRLRLSVFRNGGGRYTPNDNSIQFCIEQEELEQPFFLKKEALHIGIVPHILKNYSYISHLKTTNCLPYIIAAQYKEEQAWDDALLINSNHHIIECISSNFFMIHNNKIYTPPLDSGCVGGTMRAILLDYFNIIEKDIPINELDNPNNSYFITNAIQGIQPISSINEKKYNISPITKNLIQKLDVITKDTIEKTI